jgi:putative intracellular protease/amidase
VPGVAQRRTKLGGTWYDRGAPVPDELVTARTIHLGLVAPSSVPAAGDDQASELKATKAALEAALDRLTAAGVSTEGIVSAPAFDPAEATVPEVLAHVDSDPDDLGRVLDAELGGKARKTLLDDLARRLDEAGDSSDGDDPDDTGGNAGGE